MQTITSLRAAARTRLRESREHRAGHAWLARELACYNSPADLDDLDAILDRYSDRETADIRRILVRQRVG